VLRLHFLSKPGVLITLIPEEGRPDYLIYWLRDACLAYHAWLAELELAGNTDVALRNIVDDFVHVLIRTQHVYNPSGNVFTGGLEEALFDLHIAKITYPEDYRVGSPAAGMSSIDLNSSRTLDTQT
jgi:hypothetical protein